MSAAVKAAHARPEVKARYSAANSRPEVRARRSAACKEAQNRPETRAKMSVATKAAHARPETKARHSTSLKEANARPEVKARRSIASIAAGCGGYGDSYIKKLGYTHRFVYIFRDAERGFKIGKSVNVAKRKKQLQSSNPLKLLAKIKCTVEQCTKLEAALHRIHKKFRIKKNFDLFTKDVDGGSEYFTSLDWVAIRAIVLKIVGVNLVRSDETG